MKIPGKSAGSGSISRLGSRSIDRPPASKILIGNHENRICDPQLLLRLKTNSIVCFLRLAGHFNRTHVAINKYCSANKNQRPRWGSRVGAASGAPLRGRSEYNTSSNGENQNRRLAACATGRGTNDDFTRHAPNKIFEAKRREKRTKAPSIFVSVRKKSSLCFVQLAQILIEPMFRLERIAERRKFKGRPTSAWLKARLLRLGRS